MSKPKHDKVWRVGRSRSPTRTWVDGVHHDAPASAAVSRNSVVFWAAQWPPHGVWGRQPDIYMNDSHNDTDRRILSQGRLTAQGLSAFDVLLKRWHPAISVSAPEHYFQDPSIFLYRPLPFFASLCAAPPTLTIYSWVPQLCVSVRGRHPELEQTSASWALFCVCCSSSWTTLNWCCRSSDSAANSKYLWFCSVPRLSPVDYTYQVIREMKTVAIYIQNPQHKPFARCHLCCRHKFAAV